MACVRDRDIRYTDGFRTDTGSGVGLYGEREGVEKSLPLDEFATVQREIEVILRCVQTVLERGEARKRIKICSDSQTALKALGSPIFTSRLV